MRRLQSASGLLSGTCCYERIEHDWHAEKKRREVPVLWGYPEARIPPNRLVVLGDNPADSYDSRNFGYISAEVVLGVVVARLPSGGRRPVRH